MIAPKTLDRIAESMAHGLRELKISAQRLYKESSAVGSTMLETITQSLATTTALSTGKNASPPPTKFKEIPIKDNPGIYRRQRFDVFTRSWKDTVELPRQFRST